MRKIRQTRGLLVTRHVNNSDNSIPSVECPLSLLWKTIPLLPLCWTESLITHCPHGAAIVLYRRAISFIIQWDVGDIGRQRSTQAPRLDSWKIVLGIQFQFSSWHLYHLTVNLSPTAAALTPNLPTSYLIWHYFHCSHVSLIGIIPLSASFASTRFILNEGAENNSSVQHLPIPLQVNQSIQYGLQESLQPRALHYLYNLIYCSSHSIHSSFFVFFHSFNTCCLTKFFTIILSFTCSSLRYLHDFDQTSLSQW